MNRADILKRIKKRIPSNPIDLTTSEGYNKFCEKYGEGMRKSFDETDKLLKCRFCSGPTRALNNNGIYGPGYSEWNYACEHCGRIQ